jgi:hypothetical protein
MSNPVADLMSVIFGEEQDWTHGRGSVDDYRCMVRAAAKGRDETLADEEIEERARRLYATRTQRKTN